LKILFPFVGDSVGGSHLSTIELYKTLKENGYDVLVLLHDTNGPLSTTLKNFGVEYLELKSDSLAGESPNIVMILFRMIWNIVPLVSFLRKNNIDIVHGNDLRINLTWSVATIFSRAKFIWHQRTILSTSRLWGCIPFLSNHFIGISKAVLNTAPENLRWSKKSLVYNAFNTEVKYSSSHARQIIMERFQISNETIMGYVGRLVSYKNVDFLINCLSDLIKTHKRSIYLLVIGTGSDEYVNYLRGLVRELDLEANVSFVGFINNPLELISGIDMLVASSSVDAFGRTIVEAMLQSTPVLAAGKGGHLEIVEDGYNGLIFEANTRDSFIEKVILLLDNDSLRNSVIKAALTSSQERYSRQQHFLSVEKIYRSLSKL